MSLHGGRVGVAGVDALCRVHTGMVGVIKGEDPHSCECALVCNELRMLAPAPSMLSCFAERASSVRQQAQQGPAVDAVAPFFPSPVQHHDEVPLHSRHSRQNAFGFSAPLCACGVPRLLCRGADCQLMLCPRSNGRPNPSPRLTQARTGICTQELTCAHTDAHRPHTKCSQAHLAGPLLEDAAVDVAGLGVVGHALLLHACNVHHARLALHVPAGVGTCTAGCPTRAAGALHQALQTYGANPTVSGGWKAPNN